MLLLINPPFTRMEGVRDDSVPNGLAWLSASMQAKGIESLIYNADNGLHRRVDRSYQATLDRFEQYRMNLRDPQHEAWTEIRTVLQQTNPDVVGVTVMSAKIESARRVSQLAKQVLPGCRVVWGGQHPTILPEQCLSLPEVDFIVRSEAEDSFAELLGCLRRGEQPKAIPGVGFTQNGKMQLTPTAAPPDFSSLPFPKKDNLLFPERYGKNSMGGITATRGCPFPCGFCSASQVVGKRIRYRRVEDVADEISYLTTTFGTRVFHLFDDTFTANEQYALALCEEFVRRRLRISWSCTTRLKSLSPELLRQMVRAGCYYTSVGVESGSDRVLRQIRKGITRDDVLERIGILKQSSVAWAVYIMTGFPEETAADVDLTTDLIRRIHPERVILSFFTPYPGTALFSRCVELSLASHTLDWADYNHQSPKNDFCLAASSPEYREAIDRLVATVDETNASRTGKMRRWMRTLPVVFKRPSLGIEKVRQLLAG